MQEVRAQLLEIRWCTPNRKLDTGNPVIGGVQRRPGRQPGNIVDIQSVAGGNGRNTGNLLGFDISGQQRHDVAGPVPGGGPGLVFLHRDGRKPHLQIQGMEPEQQIPDDRRGFGLVRNFDQDAPGQVIVDDRLANIQNPHIVTPHDAGDFRRQARFVTPGDINQYQFTHCRHPHCLSRPLPAPEQRKESHRCHQPVAVPWAACGRAGPALRGSVQGH